MTDDDNGDPTPSGAVTTDQPDVSSEALTRLGGAIEDYRDQIGQAEADALEALREERGIETELELYEAAGFSGEKITLRLDAYEAEIYTLLGVLEGLTQQDQHAEQFVPLARLMDALLAETPTPSLAVFAAERTEIPVEDLLEIDVEADDPTNQDSEAAQ